MITTAILKIRALVSLAIGTRILYDCPLMGDDYRSTEFFKQYRGKQGSIVGFQHQVVGLLDSRGRLPGVYVDPSGVDVRFDGETKIHRGLNTNHLVAIDASQTASSATASNFERVGDLSQRIRFYPGDRVRKEGDDEVRLVENVRFGMDELEYVLSESAEMKQTREARKAARESLITAGGLLFPQAEYTSGRGYVLASRGNVYHLYCAPEKLSFESPQAELAFWAMDGISKTVHGGRNGEHYEFPLVNARQMVEAGQGDFVIKSAPTRCVWVGRNGEYQVRVLHEHWGHHRNRVKKLAASFKEPPEMMSEERSMNDRARDVIGI